jgi:hypothetical protein
MPTQFIRDRSGNLLSSSGFAVFSAYFAIFARVVSTFEELTLHAPRKGYLEKATICVPRQSGVARRRAPLFAQAEIGIPPAMKCRLHRS